MKQEVFFEEHLVLGTLINESLKEVWGRGRIKNREQSREERTGWRCAIEAKDNV